LESKLNYFLDPNFRFNEEEHTYVYLDSNTGKPVQTFESVTGLVGKFKKPFASHFIAGRVANKRGVSRESVLNEWAQISNTALTLGTAVHKWIEDFYNGEDPSIPEDPIIAGRVRKFKQLYEARLNQLTPIKQEFRVFSRKWNLAGTMDKLAKFEGDSTKYYVGDWKTNKKFTTDEVPEGRGQKLLWPFDDLYDNSLNSYSIQISTYRLLLQEEANFPTHGGFVVWIGPEGDPQIHKTLDLRDRIQYYLNKKQNNEL